MDGGVNWKNVLKVKSGGCLASFSAKGRERREDGGGIVEVCFSLELSF